MQARGEGRYVDALRVGGKPVSRTWLAHEELLEGAALEFRMSPRPNTVRGAREIDAPYSFSRDPARPAVLREKAEP